MGLFPYSALFTLLIIGARLLSVSTPMIQGSAGTNFIGQYFRMEHIISNVPPLFRFLRDNIDVKFIRTIQ